MAHAPGGTAVFLQNRDFFGAMVVHTPLFDALREAAPKEPLVTYAPFERGRIFESLGLADETRVYAGAGGALWSGLRERKFARIVLLRPQSFALTALTGSLMFMTNAVVYSNNTAFRMKLVLLGLAGLNTLLFELTAARTIQDWHQGTPPPIARTIATLSLALWLGVIFAGRIIGFTTTRAAAPPPADINFEDLLK